jgi:hypothetical protein
MWQAGVGTSQAGRGVSWSFLLRNAYLMLRLRRSPLQDLIGSVRLSAEGLWTFGGRTALDGTREALRELWGEAQYDAFAHRARALATVPTPPLRRHCQLRS